MNHECIVKLLFCCIHAPSFINSKQRIKGRSHYILYVYVWGRVGGIDFRVNLFQSSLEIAIFRLY